MPSLFNLHEKDYKEAISEIVLVLQSYDKFQEKANFLINFIVY